jgi:anti-sigma-K factor RskA
MSDWIGMAADPRSPRPELKPLVLARAFAARRPWRWPLAAAAGIVAALVVSGLLWRRAARLQHLLVATRDTLDLMRQPGSRVVSIPVVIGSRAGELTAFVDSASHRLLVSCHDFPANAPNQTYQLWFVTDRGMRSAGLMTMDVGHPMIMALEMPRQGVTGLAMSVEPRGGSPAPQGPMVFHVNL